jgi:hypothetical protein
MELKKLDECGTVLEPLPIELRSQHGSDIPVAHILTYSSL